MSGPLSSIMGGGGVPVGGVAPLWGAGINPTINGVEYLRSGNLKAIAGYADFAAKCPQAAFVVRTSTANKTVPNNQSVIRFMGGSYFIFGAVSQGIYANTLSTSVSWATFSTDADTTCNDAFAFGSVMIHLPNVQDVAWHINSSGTSTSFAPTTAGFSYAGAVNAAGTLGIIAPYSYSGTAGHCATSTNGTAWTQRTPSNIAGVGNGVMAVWCVPSSTFVTIGSSGYALTTADGFTYTNRGILLAGTTSAQTQAGGASSFSTYTTTATLLSMMLTVNGQQQAYLIKTTNGTSFTSVTWSSLLGFAPTSLPKLSANGATIVASFTGSPKGDTPFIFQSTDDGTSWQALATPLNTAYTGQYCTISDVRYLNGAWVLLPGDSNSQASIDAIANFTPTHIGLPYTSSVSVTNATTLTNYIRIK